MPMPPKQSPYFEQVNPRDALIARRFYINMNLRDLSLCGSPWCFVGCLRGRDLRFPRLVCRGAQDFAGKLPSINAVFKGDFAVYDDSMIANCLLYVAVPAVW